MAGGAPGGIIDSPDEDGCRTIRTIISIITMQGKSSTAPNGTDILELPFNRMRLLKKESLGVMRDFSLLRSDSDASEGVEGIRLDSLWMKPMAVMSRAWRMNSEGMDREMAKVEVLVCSRGTCRNVMDLRGRH